MITHLAQLTREEWKSALRKMFSCLPFCIVVILINISVVKIQCDQGFLSFHLSVETLPCLGSVSALQVCSNIQVLFFCLLLLSQFFLLCQPKCLELIQHHPKSILPAYSLLRFSVLADHMQIASLVFIMLLVFGILYFISEVTCVISFCSLCLKSFHVITVVQRSNLGMGALNHFNTSSSSFILL